MTALQSYDRLEATGLWRQHPDAQRREVIVSLGDATLVISDLNDTAITHWSLAALDRRGTGYPAVFHPDGDPAETLELPETETEMLRAIEKLRRAVDKARPKPGRLRWTGAAVSIAAVLALLFFWLPPALTEHALRVVPPIKQAEIGEALLSRIERVSGAHCSSNAGRAALSDLAERVGAKQIMILPGGPRHSLYLPGGIILLNRALIEDFEEPDVAAGFALAERLRSNDQESLRDVLETGGIRAIATLLTTGDVPNATLDLYAERVVAQPRRRPETRPLIDAFAASGLRSTPYAYALDISGETTLSLIEADPMSGQNPGPILQDAAWLQLQAICES
ncbi:MAG: hypothetical protein ACFB11_04450 [Paracoccaceae bacterium]